jgi:hypothetical protein
MEYTPAAIEKYLRYMKYFGNSSDGITPENAYDFEQEQMLVDKCKSGETLSILAPSSKEYE